MTLNKAYNQYKESSIFTASPEELTFMLYNGLVRYVMQAQLAIDEKEMEKANKSLIRAQDIIRHFQSTLDMKYEISQSLALLYDYLYRRLIEANIKKDRDIIDEALGLIKDLRDTWAKAMKLAKQSPKLPEAAEKV